MENAPLSIQKGRHPCDYDQIDNINVATCIEKVDNVTRGSMWDRGLSRSLIEVTGIGLAAIKQNLTCKREHQTLDIISN